MAAPLKCDGAQQRLVLALAAAVVSPQRPGIGAVLGLYGFSRKHCAAIAWLGVQRLPGVRGGVVFPHWGRWPVTVLGGWSEGQVHMRLAVTGDQIGSALGHNGCGLEVV